MSTELAKVDEQAISRPTAGLVPSSLIDAMKLAEVMCKGRLVPQHLQGQPSDCLMVIEQAMRWGLSPFAVAQATSVISGKLMYEGKLVAAVINARGDLEERLSFVFDGTGNDRTCTASGRIRGEKEPRTASVRLGDVKTGNKMWSQQPDQQMVYSASRVWARRHMPELMLGVYSPEEFDGPSAQVMQYTPPKASPASGHTTQTPTTSPPSAASAPPSAEPAASSTEEPGFHVRGSEPPPADWVMCYRYDKAAGEWVETGEQEKASPSQIAMIHVLLKDASIAEADHRKALLKYGKESSAQLSREEASDLIRRYEDVRTRKVAKARRQEERAEQAVREVGEFLQENGAHPMVEAAKNVFNVEEQ